MFTYPQTHDQGSPKIVTSGTNFDIFLIMVIARHNDTTMFAKMTNLTISFTFVHAMVSISKELSSMQLIVPEFY